MSPKQANSNSVEGSASQHNQQQDTINLSISTVPGEFAEAQQTQQNQQGDLIDLNAPEVQTVQEGSQHSQRKVDDLLCTDNQPLQQRQQKNEFFKLLKESVEGFADWPAKKQALAVAVVSAAFPTVLLVVTAALPLATAGLACATVGLALFFTVKAVSYAYKGLKWSGEKAVKGLGHVAGKTVEGAKHAAGKIADGTVEGYGSLKRGTKARASSMLNATADRLYRLAGETNYLNEIKKFTPEELKKANKVRESMKTICADTESSSKLVKNILSEISAKIDLEIAEEKSAGQTEHATDLKWQKKFVNNLTLQTLEKLLTERSLPKESYLIDSIFSEHYDDIKEVIKECKEEHTRVSTLNKLNSAAQRSKSSSAPTHSASSLPESGSSNSLNSESTVGSSAELLNSTEHKEAKRSFLSFPKIGKAGKEETTEIKYKAFSEELSPVKTATIGKPVGNRVLTPVPMPVVPNVAVPPKPSRAFMTHSDSLGSLNSNASSLSANSRSSGSESTNSLSYHRNSDSGVSSADSSPRHSGPQLLVNLDDLTKAKNDLNRRNSLPDGEFKPSTQMTVHAEVHQHDTSPKLV